MSQNSGQRFFGPDDPRIIRPNWPAPDNIVAFTTTRLQGASRAPYGSFNLASHVGDDANSVEHNRQSLMQGMDADICLQWLDQIHSNAVVQASSFSQFEASIPQADAIVSQQIGEACAVLTADCLPILLYDKTSKSVAAVHAGWRGLAQGIIENTVAAMLANRSAPSEQILAWLGPAIGACHFEVGQQVRNAFLLNQDSNDKQLLDCFVKLPAPGKYLADLYKLAKFRLGQLGISKVYGGDYCTCCQNERFYSYRKEGLTGRMASIIYRRA
ncbi:MAG: hypothetical protein COC19_06550 [SAR86 cluster bacterium]|uniref:Purine nucleoside phosphorylase n=1 Tax=SAR86 cluster bacterium TaxID=2030880 RepID=A0A2A4MII2_9GAMM|nr:MAG: hypothetical protein COC19_06550 [SAR86 cluster bacterium]